MIKLQNEDIQVMTENELLETFLTQVNKAQVYAQAHEPKNTDTIKDFSFDTTSYGDGIILYLIPNSAPTCDYAFDEQLDNHKATAFKLMIGLETDYNMENVATDSDITKISNQELSAWFIDYVDTNHYEEIINQLV